MTIEEKYNICYVDGIRYYKINMNDKLVSLENSTPFYFEYLNIKVKERNWSSMTLEVLNELDKLSPKTKEQLLDIKYDFSKTKPFSETKGTNFKSFKDVFLNLNHTATHSFMNMQTLLVAYGVDLNKCIFLVKRNPIAENDEIRTYYINKSKIGFKKYLLSKNIGEKNIEKYATNFIDVLNKLLKNEMKTAFDNLYLIDDYYHYLNYKSRLLEIIEQKYFMEVEKLKVLKNTLEFYQYYLKNEYFYNNFNFNSLNEQFKNEVKKSILFLFDKYKVDAILNEKLYSRINIMNENLLLELKEFNTSNYFYLIVQSILSDEFKFYEPKKVISNKKRNWDHNLIIRNHIFKFDKMNITELSNWIEDMHMSYWYPKDLYETVKDEYLLIDNNTIIRKSLINVEQNDLLKIKNEIEFYLNSFKEIDGDNYNGYNLFPKLLNFEWNKQLLLGILNSFILTDEDFVNFKDKITLVFLNNSINDVHYKIKLL